MSRITGHALLALVAAASVALVSAPAAGAQGTDHHAQRWHRTLTQDVVAPFQVDVERGRVYVADGATGQVSRIDRKKLTPLVTFPGEVAGLDVIDSGRTIAYTTTDYSKGNTTLTVQRKGKADVVADLSGYERTRNPDGHVRYGLIGAGAYKCAPGRAWLAKVTELPASYPGIVDSHPYAVLSLGHGWWAVAEAAGNSVLAVSPSGRVSTLALLPRQPLKLTAEALAGLGGITGSRSRS